MLTRAMRRGVAPIVRAARAMLLCLMLAACSAGETGPPETERAAPDPVRVSRPNVLWVVWDTVRSQNMSVYGHERPTTPHLERWVSGARVFDDAISAAATTTTSHASMFTGRLPFEHRVGNEHSRLAPSFPTLAEILAESGYRTYLFSANPYLGPETALDRGFQTSERPSSPRFAADFARIRRQKVRDYVRAGASGQEFNFLAASGTLARQGLLSWLERSDGGAPFFAVLNYMEAHLPLAPDRRYRERLMTPEQVRRSYELPLHGMPIWTFTAGLTELSEEQIEIARLTYDAAIAELDALFQDLLEHLDEQGALADTLVILTSDHGELLGEHHMWNHQFALYDELLRIPLILRHPERVPPGRDARPVMNLDLFPTVLEVTGSTGPRGPGVSLLSPFDRRLRLSEYPYPAGIFVDLVQREHPDFDKTPWQRSLRSLRSGDLKYIRASDGSAELFDLARDRSEQRDLSRERAAEAERLDGELRDLTRGLTPPPDAGEPARFDERTRAMLEALGYAADGEAP